MTCSTRDPVAALDRLDAALGEWRGDAFAEFAETEWIRPEAVRLEELRLVAAEARIDAQLRVGRHHEVVGEVDALRLDHPLREQFARQAMLALYRSGRQAEALRVAQQFRATLRDDLGLEPSAELRDLEAAVLEERDEPRWVPPAAPTSHRAGRCRATDALPIETTALVGRERDLELAEPSARDRSHPHPLRARRRGQDPAGAPPRRHRSPTSSPTACA